MTSNELICIFATHIHQEMKPYENNEENKVTMAAEPQVAYGSVQPVPPSHFKSYNELPEDYMTLDRFGELFHQKLDACYAELQSNSKQ